MNREFKRKLIGSIIGVTLFAALVVGATYAWLVVDLNVINANYVSRTGCFVIDYNLANSDGLTNNISGSLIPSTDALGGLTGRVGLKTNSSCNLNGVGTLKLHINDEINSALTTSVGSYCENRSTLEPMTGNDAPSTESACKTAGGRWHNYGDSFCESNSTLERLTN